MTFAINPETVVVTLRSILEQQSSRMTLQEAVYSLATKGVVLPGKTAKDQALVLNSLITLCEPGFLDVRPGKGGGVGIPTARTTPARKSTKAGLGTMVQGLRSEGDGEEENEENQQTGS